MQVSLLICAAGVGSRMGASIPKQYIEILGAPILKHTVSAFAKAKFIKDIFVVVSPLDPYVDSLNLEQYGAQVLSVGGATRADSVNNGLIEIVKKKKEEKTWVLVHDAARPCVSMVAVQNLIDKVKEENAIGGILAEKAVETLKVADSNQEISHSIDRSRIWRAQTPQLFVAQDLIEAFKNADPTKVTDEASLIEGKGRRVLLVEGNPENIKITKKEDLALAQMYLRGNMKPVFRVGQGYDSHRLVEGRPLIIGGVTIPYEKGLDGHSDADVLLHAITDALLGACGLGDIGEHFPPSEEKWKGADSALLLKEIVKLVHLKGWVIENVDATVVAEAPKFKPYKEAIRERVAQILEIDVECVSVKAKTNEKMDAVGRLEGMMAFANILVSK